MKRAGLALAAIALFTLWTSLASAHHSGVMFDFTKRVQITGIVKVIRVINPHMSLTLEYIDNGVTKTIEFEGHSANNMYRGGWRVGKAKVGDKITLIIAPRRDGADGGYINSFITATGEEVGFKLPGVSASGVPTATTPVNSAPPAGATPPAGAPPAVGTTPPNQ